MHKTETVKSRYIKIQHSRFKKKKEKKLLKISQVKLSEFLGLNNDSDTLQK